MGFFDKLFGNKAEEEETAKFFGQSKTVLAPIRGKVLAQADIPDETFAQGILGPGCGIEPTGKTVYAPAQNPTFIFRYLCEANGLTPGEDIVIDNSYAQPADLNTAVSSGAVQLAVLPEPMVTIARSANDKLTAALDLTAEWDKVAPAGSLVQGCAVVRREFAEAHPAELACFLNEYKASIEALSADVQSSAEKIQETGIFAKAAVAAKAIPNCNICFIDGADMQSALAAFYEVMYSVAPDSIGGSIPGDDFYCVLG